MLLIFNISVKLHDFVCRPRSVAAEIVIKINKHIDPYMTFLTIYLLLNNLKRTQTMAFSKYFSGYNVSSRFLWLFSFIYCRYRLPILATPAEDGYLLRGIVQGYRTKLLRNPPGSLTCSAYSTVTRDLGSTSHPKDY